MKNIFSATIKRRIYLTTFLPLVLLLALVLPVVGFHVRSLLVADHTQSQLTALELERFFIERWLQERLSDITFLARLDQLQKGSPQEIDGFLRRFADSDEEFTNAVFVSPRGNIVAGSLSSSTLSLADRAYFVDAARGVPSVSSVLTSRLSGKRIIAFASPVSSADGTFRGVIVATVQIAVLNNLMEEVNPRTGGRTYLLTRSGVLITNPAGVLPANGSSPEVERPLVDHDGHLMNDEILRRAVHQQASTTSYVNYTGKPVLGSYIWVKNGAWLLVYETPLSRVLASYRQYIGVLLGGVAVVVLILVPILLWSARSIERPLAVLETLSVQMRAQEFNIDCDGSVPGNAPREIRSLSLAFCQMARKIKETVGMLERLATTDVLTGLANRRLFLQEAPRLVEVSERAGSPCSLLMIDIDHFKEINDTYGHESGDIVLTEISSVLSQTIRDSDIVARVGGEEFAIVAPNSSLNAAADLGERIRSAVEMRGITLPDTVVYRTVSVGVAEYRSEIHKKGIDDVLAAADRALYVAKDSGRNRVVRGS
jgi:diguanylate cyclase (GGDEF)-like protein